ncbi:hypothetical protein F8154_10600 [Alkaliphilus pronyensis]|uniref:Uncharacterized protein n=1 Tax=Alkaliphilus pronyensis TaxID=1482732 RepID=A0A6I0F6X4_9FIRM|nr:hypothetical protein [Alkaliphilus pronyensis]KAB3533604.1 hypothetical protein F8154_10600 [Alkaliphilus pronyensis]
MGTRTKAMVAITIALLVILAVKSLLIDPVTELDIDSKKYHDFVLENIEENYDNVIKPLISYKIVDINQITEDGETIILKRISQAEGWNSEAIKGQYQATVRFYFLGIFPYRDIEVQIKGGVVNGD